MALFKSKQEKEIEKKMLVKRTINAMNKQINTLEEQKKVFVEKAKVAKKDAFSAIDGEVKDLITKITKMAVDEKISPRMDLFTVPDQIEKIMLSNEHVEKFDDREPEVRMALADNPRVQAIARKERFAFDKDGKPVSVADGVEKYNAGVVVPIVSEGDTIGSVLFILKEGETASEVEEKLAESAAGFLGKHMEG